MVPLPRRKACALHTRRRQEPMPLGQLCPLPGLGRLERNTEAHADYELYILTLEYRNERVLCDPPAFQRLGRRLRKKSGPASSSILFITSMTETMCFSMTATGMRDIKASAPRQ